WIVGAIALLSLAVVGVVVVSGRLLLVYLGVPPRSVDWLATCDIGLVEDGFLILHGRKKLQLFTSFVRTVNAEWVEAELVQQAPIAQAWLHGEALAQNVAAERRAYTANYELSWMEADLYNEVTDYVRNEMNRAERLLDVGNGDELPSNRSG
ncbi:hypothetical protein U8L64_00160, partial [Pseudomonas sp. FIP_A4]